MRTKDRKTVCVDANVILRLVLADEENLYKKARSLFERAEAGETTIFIDETILAECTWVLTSFYKKGRVEVVETLIRILSFDYVDNSRKDWLTEALTVYKLTNFSYADCWLMIITKRNGYQLETFDRKLKKSSHAT